MTPTRLGHPNLGLGVGLRTCHFRHILENSPFINNDHCSMLQGSFGACTVFKGAAPGQCSAFGATSNCSVENGPGPNANGVCRLP